MKTWTHPSGKLRDLGAEALTDAELLAILLSTGTKGKTAEEVAKEILDSHIIYIHPEFPELRATVARHSTLKVGYIQYAIKLIDRLKKLKEADSP